MTGTLRALSLLILLALPGCRTGDFARPGTWQATGVNDRNLQAMLADPSHAVRGVSAPHERGDTAVAPIGRLLRNERAALPARGSAPAGALAGAPTAPGGTDGR